MRIHDACLPEQPNIHRNQTTARTVYGASRLFLLLLGGTLDLCRSAEGLLSVLALLACSDVSNPFSPLYTLAQVIETTS